MVADLDAATLASQVTGIFNSYKILDSDTGEGLGYFYEVSQNNVVYLIPKTLVSITIQNAKTLSYQSLANLTNLVTLDLSYSMDLVSIADETCINNTQLVNVYMPKDLDYNPESIKCSITSIGDRAFYNNIALQRMVLSEGLVTIGTYAFAATTSYEVIEVSEDFDENIKYYTYDQALNVYTEVNKTNSTYNPQQTYSNL